MSAPFGVPQILPGSGPDMADAYNYNAPVVAQHLQQAWQQVQDPRFWADAANKWAQGILMGTTAPEVNGLAGGTAGIRAFHGSPYNFDRFSSQNIGSGEGAQAYGHGLYFAGNENVAKQYRDNVIDKNWFDDINAKLKNIAKQLNQYETPGQYGKYSDPKGYELKAEYDRLMEDRAGKSGNMYEVNIAAHPDQLLDWDKPLSEQAEAVKQVMTGHDISPDVTGADAYRLLAEKYAQPATAPDDPTGWGVVDGGPKAYDTQVHDPAAAATVLQQAGIPGIKYLDAGSRGEGQGTHNYVVFNDNLINILRKYGVPGMIGAGAASAPFGFGVGAQQ